MIRSLLPVIEVVDNFPHTPSSQSYVPFHLTLADFQHGLPPLGLLRQDVLREMQTARGIWDFEESTGKPDETGDFHSEVICVYFKDELVKKGKEGISKAMAEVVGKWREEGKFPGPLAGWRNELYTIYASPKSSGLGYNSPSTPLMLGPGTFKNVAFNLERAACALFGLATFGVHMTAYEGEGWDMKVWVPRRSKTKATWPGRLDNSVAGGITAGSTPIETMIKECDEEASLPEEFVKKRLQNCGVATYFYITDDGFLQPEVEYIYDLPLPPSASPEYIKPKPHDDEVESFALLTIPELIEALHSGDMKPNCGLIYVDFLIRHGLITPENEPNFLEISWRMRRTLQVAMPGI
ncbi:hypothetical protein L486_02589 [Kwoniella mangroviensis CBS 10435]|uniref:Nudix hydrolase domain-containing protein n=1 Tax=Kwoniella mangroviensis CBS 10435 TaxID=1331196 RepID=A0A1B9IWL3_9TREE|nr:uncharacterized protein I203_01573 [Kwoniella mangroviensis CBS 8507]OCF59916.1 hypothetical protein L486_02589 [Kwoniella mangroviensis CBS 10435]OCF69709.1 hypothetical protein I203_01573 [Kwoniella mangroviensis CBS 8507]